MITPFSILHHRPQQARPERFSVAYPRQALPEDKCKATAGATSLQDNDKSNLFGVSELVMSDVKSLFRKKTKQAVRTYPSRGPWSAGTGSTSKEQGQRILFFLYVSS